MKTKLAATGGAVKTFVDDVFSVYLYTGNGSTQTITNGIDLAGKGGLVWIKARTNTSGGATSHVLVDTVRGSSKWLASDATSSETTNANLVTGFTTSGFSVGNAPYWGNENTIPYVSWTFRKAAKFFDVVTYTGTGSAQTIAHSLGVAPGMIIVKRTDASGYSWVAWNRGLSTDNSLKLNTTAGEVLSAAYIPTAGVTSTSFQVGGGSLVSDPGTYVAYLFAHDTSSTGIIQCGSCTGSAQVELGWEPQYLLIKAATTTDNWQVYDTMRGWTTDGNEALLVPNTSNAEVSTTTPFRLNATGFKPSVSVTDTYIYMAIRRPNKPPTSGTQVYAPVTYTGDGTTSRIITTGIITDLIIGGNRIGDNSGPGCVNDRLRGQALTITNSTLSESVNSAYPTFDLMTGYNNLANGGNFNYTGYSYIRWAFKRAPGFFDEVCFPAPSNTNLRVSHNLGVAPELIIVKDRSGAAYWSVYVGSINTYLRLNATNALDTITSYWGTSAPTPTDFGISVSNFVAAYGDNLVAYLFATLAGIQYINSYVGDGTTGRVINCGFSAGARFICIKATSTTGSWWVWDSARGITSGNDPALQLNSTAAEITSADAIDPSSSGFIVNQEATCSINASGVSYLVWAIA